jgi:hypothetical protein
MVKTNAHTTEENRDKKAINGLGILILQSLHSRRTVNRGAKQPPTYKNLLEKLAISKVLEVYRK